MVDRLERHIDALDEQFDPPTEFVVPGGNVTAAWLDLARTVVRRAERHSLAAAAPPSLVVPYLNRLSDLLWTMARWQEAADGSTLRVRDVGADGQTDDVMSPLPGSVLSFNPTPSIERSGDVVVTVARAVPETVGVGRRAGRGEGRGAPPARARPGHARGVRLRRQGRPDARRAPRATARASSPSASAIRPTLDAARLRDAAAAFGRAAAKHAQLATTLDRRRRRRRRGRRPGRRRGHPARPLPLRRAEEGDARHRADRHHARRRAPAGPPASAAAPTRGHVIANAAQLARDLANTPPGHLTASRIADVAIAVGRGAPAWRSRCSTPTPSPRSAAAGCSASTPAATEPPRMIKLTYRPAATARPPATWRWSARA